MNDMHDASFLAPRHCLREPIPALWEVARLLDRAADAHLAGDRGQADVLFREANRADVRAWTKSLWGSAQANPDQWRYRRVRQVADAPPRLSRAERAPGRQPTAAERSAVIARYGRHCVFCGVPLVRAEVRTFFHRLYPEAVPWGAGNATDHAAFQALWLQFDHVLPHSRGGDSSLSNVVVTCAGCNYGRMDNTLEELGLIDPRLRPAAEDAWDGLERVLLVSPPSPVQCEGAIVN